MSEFLTNDEHPLNAIPPNQPEDAADRTARHMGMCAELADLAMQLARAAAARALTDLAEPEQSPREQPLADPAQEVAEPIAAQAVTPRHTTAIRAPYLRTQACKSTDPALLFTRLAAVVRDCIALEARLAAGTAATSARTISGAVRNDPRRATLIDGFHHVTQNRSDRTELRRECERRLDEELEADPDQTLRVPDVLYKICDDLEIEIDFAHLPDKYMGIHWDRAKPIELNATSPP